MSLWQRMLEGLALVNQILLAALSLQVPGSVVETPEAFITLSNGARYGTIVKVRRVS